MWFEIFKFEVLYRVKRVETYLFFVILFLCSLVAFNFIFEGQNLGLVKENAPYVIAKIMAIVSGGFMVITSMIMGVPILRDFEYNMESLLFVNPIKKRDYLLGRFLGSFFVLVFVFSGLLWGMILGDFMPWRDFNNLLSFQFWHYLKPFLTVVLPNLFFGGSLFFVTGALTKKWIVVYTQGLLFFFISILSFAIENQWIAAILEPFSHTAIDEVVQHWAVTEQNNLLIPIEGILLYNRIFWILLGLLILVKGYHSFQFTVLQEKSKHKHITKQTQSNDLDQEVIKIPQVRQQEGWISSSIQLQSHALFYFKSLFKEASFLSILIVAIATLFINSINLGTAYGVNSYPTTYLILEELQEMSIYFFLMILIFYVGELLWKERSVQVNLIYDALPMSDFINLAGKLIGLVLIYIVLLLGLMLAGIAFQSIKGYYHFDLWVYFIGLFLEILSFLTFFTILVFFFQVITNSKFIGHLLALSFFIVNVLFSLFFFSHGLTQFGGISLQMYSDMNGYGHFMGPYLWFKLYWLAFCILLFVVTVVFNVRGTETAWKIRWRLSQQRLSQPLIKLAATATLVFALTGGYIFYNTNVLNRFYSNQERSDFRAAYEQTLKAKEYLVQPKIVAVNLNVDLFPKNRNYVVEGYYLLVNKDSVAIPEIHIQKRISDEEQLEYVKFEQAASLNKDNETFGYFVYVLDQALQPGDSLRMAFKQTATTKGFKEDSDDTQIVQNGTFFNNDRFPTLGYNRKYELQEVKERKQYGLPPRKNKAKRDDPQELKNGRSGGDGDQIIFEIIISTASDQTAIAPGELQRKWMKNKRSYFHYKMNQPMINFYSIVSARYEVMQDKWTSPDDSTVVDLEIYHHKGHEYNLGRMMQSMKASLTYYSQNLSPYPYEQMRIMEYPRYRKFAQSFPNTVPYSEAIGFMLDVDEEKEVDMPFFITAHELAHQWWGLQLVAANVQGKHLILESLSQYAALMVLKQAYSEKAVTPFLKMEMERYQKGRKNAAKMELPLALVEDEEYIYYSKGAINMYALQDYISEERVNLALKRFIQDWNSADGLRQKDRFPTSADLISYFSTVTPDSLQYLITDLFETNTFFENKITQATYTPLEKDQYQINLSLEVNKFRVDSLNASTPVQLNDWIDIGVYARGKDGVEELIYLEKHYFSTAQSNIEIIVEQMPTQVGIDPLYKWIDLNTEDNVFSF